MIAGDEPPEWTPLGLAVKRWFPVIALVLAAIIGALVLLVSGAVLPGLAAFGLMLAALLLGFYLPPPGRRPPNAS